MPKLQAQLGGNALMECWLLKSTHILIFDAGQACNNNVIPPSLDEANEIRLLLPTINGMGDFRLGVLHSCLIFSRRPSEHVEPRSRSMCASLSNARRRC